MISPCEAAHFELGFERGLVGDDPGPHGVELCTLLALDHHWYRDALHRDRLVALDLVRLGHSGVPEKRVTGRMSILIALHDRPITVRGRGWGGRGGCSCPIAAASKTGGLAALTSAVSSFPSFCRLAVGAAIPFISTDMSAAVFLPQQSNR